MDRDDLSNALRFEALEGIFGAKETEILVAAKPLHMGGDADVVQFKHHISGVVYVTSGLTLAENDQKSSEWKQYELMICHRDSGEDWGAETISRLAPYTLEYELQPGHTMDLGESDEDSTLSALYFDEYATFEVQGDSNTYGVLLAVGITEDELEYIRQLQDEGLPAHMIFTRKLEKAGVFPYTDLQRDSIVTYEDFHNIGRPLPDIAKAFGHGFLTYMQHLQEYLEDETTRKELFEAFKELYETTFEGLGTYEKEVVESLYVILQGFIDNYQDDESFSEEQKDLLLKNCIYQIAYSIRSGPVLN
ncbi:MAG: suppressor of fused domain protein [Blastochloris viridis]|uniref:Suppressor of fused domain protein n=1 Tax=Blastochloris viridis TaxID=1079 RepID=A0A6N4RAW5_BLAVI|nr:MAG: suppressor of fused domain protein [Blastochloris viridis]